MSKKMMKRSLALGALMAFVITGSAMAAEPTVNLESDVTAHGVYYPYDSYGEISNFNGKVGKIWNLGKNTLWVDDVVTYSRQDAYAVHIQDYQFNGDVGSVLRIEGTNGTALERGFVGGGSINVDTLIVNVKGHAFHAESKDMTVTANNIKINCSDDSALYANNADIVVNVKEKLEIETDKVAIRGNGNEGVNSSVTVKTADDATEKADIIIKGNIDTLGNGIVNLQLETADSSFTGGIVRFKNIASNDNVNLTLSDKATWNVTEVSKLNVLSGDGGNVVVNDVTATQVTVGTDNSTDLTVSASADAKGITGDAETDLAAVSKTVVVGADATSATSAADTAKVIGGSVYDEVSATVNSDGTLGKINKVVAAANHSASDMAALGLMSWRAEMNDMNKRMGELRNANGEHGVWVRMVRGEDEYKSVKNQYNTYQLGYDEKLSVDKRWTVGAAVSYTDGETSFAKGSGENTNKAFSVYGSKLNADGTFIDLIAKYARLENEFKTASGMGDADYSTNGYSVSAEFGKRIQQGNGLWVEPQVELTYGKVSAVDYLSKAGVKVAQDGMESIVGRVGFSLGKDIKQGNVYARASYLYDFDGETSVSLGGQEKLEQDLGGGWWEVGVGTNINLSKATYIYADVEKTFGGEVDTNWQWNLGVRYSF